MLKSTRWNSWARLFRRRPKGLAFTGNYATWEEALRDADGYAAPVILEKTRAALLQVKSGEAAYERDSVLFDAVQHPFPLLAGLLRAAVEHSGRLALLDFGGSLGSTYFQCREFLRPVAELTWGIVEQPAYVACGRRDFETAQLRFFEGVDDCLRSVAPNVLLLSAVLHYLPEPYTTLADLTRRRVRYLIIDRTPFLVSGRERLTVQHVPATIYRARYPAWFFSETRLTQAVRSDGYELVAEFAGFDELAPPDEAACCKGLIFRNGNAAE